ncbi:MAG TPA: hypothetical protein VNA19_16170 [Pyrinomonadaceae bacterium]|nr:hypothetical protein [Pyrinomonadaceae bacterium]
MEQVSTNGAVEALPERVAAAGEQQTASEPHTNELGMWLCALQSFFDTRNHPLDETERAGILSRDFRAETRIAQIILLRSARLVHALLQGEAAAPGAETEMTKASSFVARSLAFETEEQDASLVHLNALLGDAWGVAQALSGAVAVGLAEWSSFGKTLLSELEHSPAATRLMQHARHASHVNLQPALPALAERLTPDVLSANVHAIFSQLGLLLERLRFVEHLLRRDQPLKQTLPVFTLVQAEARDLLRLIETRALPVESSDTAVFESLDGTAYAIRMELRKTFAHELVGLSVLRQAPALYAKVEAAHGLLRDCFQQSTLALAQVFDQTLDGARLFTAFQTKLEQSLKLRQDLWTLLELVSRAEQERERRPLAPLLERLNAFREGSMRYLMYKDWETFERFVEEVAAARGVVELGPVLHRLNAYLETLFGQVNIRAVLSDHPFDFPAVAD